MSLLLAGRSDLSSLECTYKEVTELISFGGSRTYGKRAEECCMMLCKLKLTVVHTYDIPDLSRCCS